VQWAQQVVELGDFGEWGEIDDIIDKLLVVIEEE
jgi:hypothetical protein